MAGLKTHKQPKAQRFLLIWILPFNIEHEIYKEMSNLLKAKAGLKYFMALPKQYIKNDHFIVMYLSHHCRRQEAR